MDCQATEAVVLARMSSALEVLGADGAIPADATPSEYLRQAVGWQRYAGGPVSALHRACAMDAARGLLRLWVQAGGTPETLRYHPWPAQESARHRRVRDIERETSRRRRIPAHTLVRLRAQQERIALAGQARTRCAALRAELQEQAAALSHRELAGFEQRVHTRVRQIADEFETELYQRMARLPGGADLPIPLPAVPGGWPARPHRPALEDRLAAVFGTGFGLGVALTVGRLLAESLPTAGPAVIPVCAAVGVGLAGWVVRSRRLLAARTAMDRWVAEVAAGLRMALEERVLATEHAVLAAQISLVEAG